MIRKTIHSALAVAVLAATAIVTPVSSASANGYGYYSPGNGYYGYRCRQVKVRYWNGYGWAYRYVERCW